MRAHRRTEKHNGWTTLVLIYDCGAITASCIEGECWWPIVVHTPTERRWTYDEEPCKWLGEMYCHNFDASPVKMGTPYEDITHEEMWDMMNTLAETFYADEQQHKEKNS